MSNKQDVLLEKVNSIIKQPNSVVEARYEFTEIQMNVLTLIIGQIQNIMTKNLDSLDNLKRDLFNNLEIDIDLNLVGGRKDIDYKLREIKALRRRDVDFVVKDKEQENWEINTSLISAVGKKEGKSLVKVWINKHALPWLIYYGGGIGFTKFNPKSILSANGKHAKRMYLLLARYYDYEKNLFYTIDEFKEKMQVGAMYKQWGQLKDKVIEPAFKELKEKSDIWFEYEPKNLGKGKGFTHIEIKILGDRPKKRSEEKSLFSGDQVNVEVNVLMFNNFYFEKYEGFASVLLNYLKKKEVLFLYAEKVEKIRKDIDAGKYGVGIAQVNKVRATIQRILVEDFGFQNDTFELFGLRPVKSADERQSEIKDNWLKNN